MKKLTVLLLSMIFIGAMFAFPFNSKEQVKPENYREVFEKFKNIEVSDPATFTGTIKEVYIELDEGLSKSRIILDTDEGTEVEVYVGPMWKFFDFKPGMKIEIQAVEIKLNEKLSFNLAFKLTSDGITVEFPYRKIIREKLAYMKKLEYQKRLYQNQKFKKAPMYQYGPMMPYYGNPYGYPPMGGQQQMPYNPPTPQKGWK
ncbi:MAG: hypothetical protein J7J43_01700 [Thermosipho sp. (in: Bacteria)]|nr:hypothetical protein [Thermosipho sp. (in: thermotogales)]MCD6104489.1 hypothetical protein [Thermosipho sp. (in: thermotogales)]